MIEDGAFTHKINYIAHFLRILNLKGHHNCIIGSRVTKVLLNGWILPIGGASALEGLWSLGLPYLVNMTNDLSYIRAYRNGLYPSLNIVGVNYLIY